MFYQFWRQTYLTWIQAEVAKRIDATSFMRYNGDGSLRVMPNIGAGC